MNDQRPIALSVAEKSFLIALLFLIAESARYHDDETTRKGRRHTTSQAGGL